MDIVEKGNSSWNMEVTCEGYRCTDYPCFSKLLISKEDIVLLHDWRNSYGFVCPNCHQFTKIDDDSLPYSVKANALRIAEKGSLYYGRLKDANHPLSEKEEHLCEIVIVWDSKK